MTLRDFFEASSVNLNLVDPTKEGSISELVHTLRVDERATNTLIRLIMRREQLGSTGIGRGVAVPHARSMVVNRLRIAFGRHPAGIDYGSVDGKPVHFMFLLIAPPHEVSNQYVPVLGKIAQFARDPDTPDRLRHVSTPEEFFSLLDSKGV
jgi:mannitol/fructose-specific phosphotransferase system IIA component (Ntr-type)